MDKTTFACLVMWLATFDKTRSTNEHIRFVKEFNNHVDCMVYNSTVSKNEPGAHRTIMDALAGAPTRSDMKYYIHVEVGVYVERIEIGKNLTNIVLVGDGAQVTRVQWNRHSPNYSTSQTGTITVLGDGFIAMFITFANTAGEGFQAVAAMTNANHVVYYKCSFLGYQDTVFAKSRFQFYRECDIYGTIDFICGAAAAVFQSCNLYADRPGKITFTAQKRGDLGPSHPSAFVIQNCTFTVAPGFESSKNEFRTFLGRPWSNYSTVVVMESYLDSIVQPSGWIEWSNSTQTNTVICREFDNKGVGAEHEPERVNWIEYRDLSGYPDQVCGFTVGEFINK